MLEMPILLLGIWCSPVRWELNNQSVIYSRSMCWRGDSFLQIDQTSLISPYAGCNVTRVARLGNDRWKASNEMAYSAWADCSGGKVVWKQKVTFLENSYLKVLSDWVEYTPGYAGPGRTLIRW